VAERLITSLVMMTSLGKGIATGYLVFVALGLIIAFGVLWSAPTGLAPGVQRRLGGAGRTAVRVAVGTVALGSLVIAGMALAHGVVLPPL
jgi:hypothetical protein